MTSNQSSVRRLQEIDESNRHQHSAIEPGDQCYFLREYTAKAGGWRHGGTNNLIDNFQKSPRFKGGPAWDYYKPKAIAQLAQELRSAIPPELCAGFTFVPVPSSKAKTDPEYDDRLLRLLAHYGQNASVDVRELVIQTKSMDASKSLGGDRHSWMDLCEAYAINDAVCNPAPANIIIIDDVLTKGDHFRAMKVTLQKRFPSVNVYGIFLARTVY